jgi:hypothetical protein
VIATGIKVTVADAVLVESAPLVAITEIVCVVLTVAGAVYVPATTEPTPGGLTLQVRA